MTQAAPSLEIRGLNKRFGALRALDDVTLKVAAGSFHALLGENGAGKSTLVKCVMGFYGADSGEILLDGRPAKAASPREASALGFGMVYQHFTLAPCLTVAENLVISRADAPAVIDWRKEKRRLEAFMARTPFRLRLDAQVSALSAGEKQKLEILKLLYLERKFLILDEPTSVLTPGEADEILGLLGEMARRVEVTVLMISHKFREVKAYCDAFTVRRRGRLAGAGDAQTVGVAEMSRMMVGEAEIRARAARKATPAAPPVLELADLRAEDDEGRRLLNGVSLNVKAGEILGIAGVSGNGQSALMEALFGQRQASGVLRAHGEVFAPIRKDFRRLKIFGLPEEPLKNAVAPRLSVAENLAFRNFDQAPWSRRGWLSLGLMRRRAEDLIARYRVKTPSPEAAMETLSGGNVQRAVLARELSGEVEILIVANPCFGLDFASVAEIRGQIMEQRNKGAAVLLVSEDLEEIFELADRVAVMTGGEIAYLAPIEETDVKTVGAFMAGGDAKAAALSP